jgi:hypothetical protein
VAVVEALGSGALVDLAPWGLPAGPVVAERVRRGAPARGMRRTFGTVHHPVTSTRPLILPMRRQTW